ncbi:MAG: GLUG motif-containing protein [Rhizomicrobium sp.]
MAGATASGLPASGKFSSGKGSITTSGTSMTVKQSSTNGVIDWKTFSIGTNNSVAFNNGNGATLNRVTGGNLSRIAGTLHATGSLFVMNAAGVIVTGTGRLKTGGSFVASSGQLSGDAFGDGGPHFLKAKAAIVNRGSIVSRGDTALTGGRVINSGTIRAASAEVRAENGAARDSGTIRANGDKARILVISDSGRTTITGALTTRGTGTIETSGRRVSISGKIDAGNGGSWSIDPVNLTVTAKAAKTIDASLAAGTNVTLKTTKKGASGAGTQSSGPGNIIIDSALTWNTSALLTLDAYHGIQFDAGVKVAGKGGVSLVTDDGGSGGDYAFGKGDSLTFANLASALTINGARYTLVNNIATLASDIAKNPSGDYALANNYNAKADGTYAASPVSTQFAGTFEGLGNTISNLTIDDETANAEVGLFANVGGVLRDIVLTNAAITGGGGADVGELAGLNDGSIFQVSVSGTVTDGGANASIGGLVGFDSGAISLSKSSATVKDTSNFDNVGGLVGWSYHGTIEDSSTSGEVEGEGVSESVIGGLVGENQGTIAQSHATGVVTMSGLTDVGGLVGFNLGTIDGSYASATVSGSDNNDMGGLVGFNQGTIANSYATGSVTGSYYVGGLVGLNEGTITSSHATGTATGEDDVGGLVGVSSSVISNSYATGAVTGGDNITSVGGLVGWSEGAISNSYATGAVTGGNSVSVGGLVGLSEGAISNSYATGIVKGGDDADVGGLVGYIQGTAQGSTTDSYATGAVKGGTGASLGGLVGYDESSTNDITDSYWDTATSGIETKSQGVGNRPSEPGITAKTTAQLQAKLLAGFSKTIWAIDPDINGGLPYLIALAKSY